MLSPEEKQAIVDLFPFIGDRPIVIDAGSNKGHFSELILSEFKDKCELHLFEPNKMLLDYTRIKFEYDKNITYNELGISDKSGNRDFYYFENFNNEISSVFPDIEGWKDLPMKEGNIHVVTIDDYCKWRKIESIDFLKLDIEGCEVDALNGCNEMFLIGSIKIIQIEYGGHYKRANKTFQEVIGMSSHFGYKIYQYSGGNFVELADFKEDYAAENYYITKEAIANQTNMGYNSRFVEATKGLAKVDMCLEVGAFEGTTTRYMAENMLNDGGRVIVVDPMNDFYVVDDSRYHPEFRGQYQRFLRNTRGIPVELNRGFSENELPKLNSLRFNFIYVDGNHYAPWPYFDGCWSFAICKIGGHILFDDYDKWADETKDSIDKFLNEFSESLEIVSKDYQVLIRKTKDQYNSLTQSYY